MVLVIIGLMTSAVVMTLPRQPSEFDKSVKALTVQMNMLSERSIVTALPTAIGLSDSGYVFYEFQNAQWKDVKAQDWPQDVSVALKKNERILKLLEVVETPQIVFQPTGMTTPFEITLSSVDAYQYISSPGFGDITSAAFIQKARGR